MRQQLTVRLGFAEFNTLRGMVLAGCLVACPVAAFAQTAPAGPAAAPTLEAAFAAALEEAQVGPPATLTYANRPIVQLRLSILGRSPAERVAAAKQVLDGLVESGVTEPVETRVLGPGISIEVAGRHVIGILPADVDVLHGETPSEVAQAAAGRLQLALNEANEARRPRELIVGALQALVATAAFVVMVSLVMKLRRRAGQHLGAAAERSLQATKIGDQEFLRSSRIVEVVGGTVTSLSWVVGLFLTYWWLTFCLRRFPYTRPWGESLRTFLLERLSSAGGEILAALPELFTVFLIALFTRFLVRIVRGLFQAVEDGRITIPWVYPETAQPTRKLVTVGLWLFALAMAYPFLPGSDTDAFKGVSVFVGLVVSLGSSGLVNQVMSGFTLTYSRALRAGDFVVVGDTEGTVEQMGTLSTKIKTNRGEDVTIPNAVMVSNIVTNYSRFADAGVLVPTDVTIGYDVPWRQVQAILLLAAARTPGVRREPAPSVLQASLEDCSVRYRLLFCPEQPVARRRVLAAVHANILDLCNEYGVQIMTPSYEGDPNAPKVIPRDRWFSAPAVAPSPTDGERNRDPRPERHELA